ncbi:hypothetical protein [Paraburkholderia terrae]|uniref:hypothetical protein n=1 Tax=Paraburkholderia terrae TaxID=311230 RepID=UPI0012DFF6BC|nr:hypothetical protein [Paraburkholderia terrae]
MQHEGKTRMPAQEQANQTQHPRREGKQKAQTATPAPQRQKTTSSVADKNP